MTALEWDTLWEDGQKSGNNSNRLKRTVTRSNPGTMDHE